MSNWTEWLGIESIHDKAIRNNYRWPGVYKIRLVDSERNPIKIGRFLTCDNDGIIAIGHSKSVDQRIKQFLSAIHGKEFKHSVANRLFLIIYISNIGEHSSTGNSKIEFAALRLKDKSEAKWEEERLLKTCFKEFGELPPLNGALPNNHDFDWKTL